MRQPCLIEMQRIHLAVEHLFNHLDVINNAVVCTLRQRHHAGDGVFILNEGVGVDFLFDVGPLELLFGDRTNNAEVVTRWHQENRNRPHHGDGMNHRFMAIAINDHNVPRSNRRVPNNLIGRGRAIGDEKQVIGIENSRSIAFAG